MEVEIEVEIEKQGGQNDPLETVTETYPTHVWPKLKWKCTVAQESQDTMDGMMGPTCYTGWMGWDAGHKNCKMSLAAGQRGQHVAWVFCANCKRKINFILQKSALRPQSDNCMSLQSV